MRLSFSRLCFISQRHFLNLLNPSLRIKIKYEQKRARKTRQKKRQIEKNKRTLDYRTGKLVARVDSVQGVFLNFIFNLFKRFFPPVSSTLSNPNAREQASYNNLPQISSVVGARCAGQSSTVCAKFLWMGYVRMILALLKIRFKSQMTTKYVPCN